MNNLPRPKCLFIDAMGVLYASGDDVGDLLVPFCREKGSVISAGELLRIYMDCSLGKFKSAELWKRAGLDRNWDAEYVQRYSLNQGVPETLALLKGKGYGRYCLSNDVAEWSLLLRKRFSLEKYFDGWIISGEEGVRKPDPRIFDLALKKANLRPEDCLFIDDRVENLKEASRWGWKVLKYGEARDEEAFHGLQAASFPDILKALNDSI